MTDQQEATAKELEDNLNLLHSLSDIYYNLKGRRKPTDAHKTTLDNLEIKISVLTNKLLENLNG